MAASYMLPWKVLQCSKSNGDGRVQMGAGDVAGRQDDDHHCEASGCCQADQRFGSFRLLIHDGSGGSGKDQHQSAYELRSHLSTRLETRNPHS